MGREIWNGKWFTKVGVVMSSFDIEIIWFWGIFYDVMDIVFFCWGLKYKIVVEVIFFLFCLWYIADFDFKVVNLGS